MSLEYPGASGTRDLDAISLTHVYISRTGFGTMKTFYLPHLFFGGLFFVWTIQFSGFVRHHSFPSPRRLHVE